MTFVIDEVRPSFGARIGGRWAIALQKWVVTLFLMPLLAAGYTKDLGNTKDMFLWMCFALAGLCIVGTCDFLLDRTLFRRRREHPVSPWWVVVNSAAGGFFIGCSAWLGGSLVGVSNSTQMAIRIPGLTLLGASWGVLISLVLDYLDRANTSRRRHIDQMVQLELIKVQQSAIVDEVIQSVRDETNLEIARIRDLMSEIADLPSSEASAAMRASAVRAIQPLSKKLWESAKNSYPTLRMRDVFIHAVSKQPFRPWLLAALTVALTIVDRISRLGLLTGVVVTILIALGVVVQLPIANNLMLGFPHHHVRIFVGAIFFIEIQTVALVVWERRLMGEPISYAEIVLSVAASVFLIFLSTALRSFDLVSGEVARFAVQGVEAERISSIARDQQISAAVREMAQVLHGTVQTRLVACAMALDLAAQAGDGESANAALLEARRVLSMAPIEAAKDGTSLGKEIQRKAEVWTGLCVCKVRIDECEVTPDMIDRIGLIVEEGISNAVRHGGATEIDISVSLTAENAVEVLVTDNGRGLANGSMGVGSAIIENASGGHWNLRARDRGCILSAQIQK
jgi:signal transduction histidine kinase